MADQETPSATYEELAAIEDAFEEIDTEMIRKQYALSTPVYTKRAAVIAKIPNFWPLVIEQAPQEIDQFIQPKDSQILVENLTSFEVTRPGIAAESGPDSAGSGENPRSFKLRFEFKANDDFEDTVLEKSFWHRRAKDGWSGLVSEPVNIRWKTGKDLTEGLTGMASRLFEARRKTGDFENRGLQEYTALKKKVEHANGMNTSFFTWFGWVSSRRYVSAEESAEAEAKRAEAKGEDKSDGADPEAPDLENEELADDDQEVEVHEAGEDIAVSFAEDIWPGAIKYFTQAQEQEDMSDVDFEEMDDEEDSADEDAPVDIRGLVGASKPNGSRSASGGAPPSKKRKT
ncbi:hypothetical protein LTR95_016879 [Oleoguttula sp. CCFEE 5521]